MKTDIFICTYARDFPYLEFCLRSIAKFATGFNRVLLLVPNEDIDGTHAYVSKTGPHRVPITVVGYEEKPGKGMLWHMRNIMYADTFSDAEVIAHMDADCIFTDPVTPDYLLAEDGKIILRYEPFESICKRHDAMMRWQECTTKCLPFPPKHETMRSHPEAYHRDTYRVAREAMEKKTKRPVDDYILAQENTFPQTFCEHVTLGNVAMELQPQHYHPVLQTSDTPMPDPRMQQFWSHGSIGEPQDIWVRGKQQVIVPIKMIQSVLGRYVPDQEAEERMAQ